MSDIGSWQLEPLANLAANDPDSFVDGPFGSNLKRDEYTQSGVRLIQLQNIGRGEWDDRSKKYISAAKLRGLKRHGAKPGDIAIAKMAEPVARACVVPPVDEDFIVVADCIKLRVDPAKCDSRWLVSTLNSDEFRRRAEVVSTGTTRLRINLSTLKRLATAVPPLSEQRAIAQILDTVDDTIRSTARLIAKLEQVRMGLLHDLLTWGLDESGALRSPSRDEGQFDETPLGIRPRDWSVARLGEIADTFAGGTPSRSLPGMYHGGVPWVKSGELNQPSVLYTEESITQRALAVSSLKLVPAGVPIVAMYGATAGVVSWLGIEATTNQAVLAILPKGGATNPRWLYWELAFATARLLGPIQGSGQPNLSKSTLDDTLLAVPQPAEQARIAQVADCLMRRTLSERTSLVKLQGIKQGLTGDLVGGRVCIHVDSEAIT